MKKKRKCCKGLLAEIKVDLLVFNAHVLIVYYMYTCILIISLPF